MKKTLNVKVCLCVSVCDFMCVCVCVCVCVCGCICASVGMTLGKREKKLDTGEELKQNNQFCFFWAGSLKA